MQHILYSRRLQRSLTFSRPGRHYIYLDLNGQPGTLGQQICDGGRLLGPTLTYSGEDAEAFRRICQRWYRRYLQNLDT